MNSTITILKYLICKYGELKITIDGDCMAPILNNAEKVLIKNCNEYKIGDIVLSASRNKVVIHRVVKIKKDKIITKGDHSYLCDKNVGSCIIGKAEINISQDKVLRTTFLSTLKGRKSYLESVIYRSILKSKNKYSRFFYKLLYRIV